MQCLQKPNIVGEIESGKYRKGRGAVNYFILQVLSVYPKGQ